MLTLWDYFRSSASYRVRIALNYKGLDYQAIPIHLLNNGGEQFSAEYQNINPQQLVPALGDDGKIITQSLAIIEYLEEKHPQPALLPNDPIKKAHARGFALAIAADMHPLSNLRVLKYLTAQYNLTDQQKKEWCQHWMQLGLTALENLASNHGGEYCVGDQLTIADVCLVPQMFNARRFACDLSAYPTLVRIDAKLQKLDAFVKAQPMETAA